MYGLAFALVGIGTRVNVRETNYWVILKRVNFKKGFMMNGVFTNRHDLFEDEYEAAFSKDAILIWPLQELFLGNGI